MEKLNFSISINAPKEKVWNTLWQDASYRAWTSAFSESSYALTDNWKKGSKVLFLDAKGSGIVSTVAENIPNEYMAFRHLGEVKDGEEDTSSEQAKKWAGATENYILTATHTGTNLVIEMEANISEGFKKYFEKVWPVALEKLKVLAEEK